MAARPRVLFVCTGNACRSQMAEGWLRHLAGAQAEVLSAGVLPSGVHPLAVEVMREAGVDLTGQRSKDVRALAELELHTVITLCDHARQVCPAFPHAGRQLHWSVEDPIVVEGAREARLAAFRATRDELRARLEAWLAESPFA